MYTRQLGKFFGLIIITLSVVVPTSGNNTMTILVNCDPKKEACLTCYQYTCGSMATQSTVKNDKKLQARKCTPGAIDEKTGKTVFTKDCLEKQVAMGGFLPRRPLKRATPQKMEFGL